MKMKKLLALVLALVMVVGMLPAMALAIDPAVPSTDANGVYQIGTAAELLWFQQHVSDGNNNANAVLIKDIDLAYVCGQDVNTSWAPIPSYGGTFDGRGHVISNLYITGATVAGQGLFATLTSSGVIKNVGIKSANVAMDTTLTASQRPGSSDIAALVGINSGKIMSCFVDGSAVTSNAKSQGRAGAVVGNNNGGTITNSFAINCTIEENNNKGCIGGIAGASTGGKITNCYSANVTLQTSFSSNVKMICGYVASKPKTVFSNNYFYTTTTRTDTNGTKIDDESWFKGPDGIEALGDKAFRQAYEGENYGFPMLTFAPLDKTALNVALAQVPESGYHTANDRYNGNDADTIDDPESGFWMQMLAAAEQARSIDDNATQEEADAAATALSAAISKLIPDTEVNATDLYEIVTAEKQENRAESDFTAASWAAYHDALSTADSFLNSLFGENRATINIAANQDVAAGYAYDLRQKAGQLYSLSAQELNQNRLVRLTKLMTALIAIAEQAQEADYTADSWSVFAGKLNAAKQAEAPVLTNTAADTTAIDTYSERYENLYHAYYWDLIPKGEITVTIQSLDSEKARYQADILSPYGTESRGGLLQEVTLNGVYTLKSLISSLNLNPVFNPQKPNNASGRRILVNGVFITEKYPVATDSRLGVENVWDTNENIRLHPGDRVDLIWRVFPTSTMGPTMNSTNATLYQYEDSLTAMRFFEGEEAISTMEVQAGTEFSLSLKKSAAALGNAVGYTPAADMTLFQSELLASAGGNHPTPTMLQQNGQPVMTDKDGKAALTFYDVGWILLTAYDLAEDIPGDQFDGKTTPGEYHSVNFGGAVWVHVLPATDETAVKTALKDELTALAATYPEEIYAEDDWTEIGQLAEDTAAAIDSAATIGAAREAQQTAITRINTIQANTLRDNETKPADFRAKLAKMPEDPNSLTQAQSAQVQALIAAYRALTPYQLSLLTAPEVQRYEAIKAVYDAGLGDAASYALTVTVTADTAEATAAAQAMTAWLQANTSTADHNGSVAAVQLKPYATYIAGEQTATSAAALQRVSIVTNPNYAAWFHLRDSGTHSISGAGWEIRENGGLRLVKQGMGYIVQGSATVLFNDVEYTLASVDVEGVETAALNTGSYNFLDASTYLGKAADYPNIYFDEAYLAFDMPYQAVTVNFVWAPVSPTAKLEAAYAQYDRTDYTAEGWTSLTAAYQKGKTDIADAGDDAAAANGALETALTAMAGVAPRPAGDYGSVKVTVRNDTYATADGAAWDGALVENVTVDLTATSTMMSCVSTALAGHSVVGAERGYISDIDGLAAFSCGNQSGWMGTLNDWFTNEGFKQFTVANDKLHDGDVISIEYTCALGLDIRGGIETNHDTSLYALTLTNGTLSPAFDPAVTDYVFTLDSGASTSIVSFTNNNRSFQSRGYLNSYAPTAVNYIRSGDTVTVAGGDVLYVGVGESVWPAMGSGTATKYQITVVSADDAAGAEKLIAAIGSVTYTNYKDKQAAVNKARVAYDALSDEAKGKVGNIATLTAAEAAIEEFKAVDAFKTELKAIPSDMAQASKADLEALKTHYEALTQKDLLTVAEKSKYDRAALALQGIIVAASAAETLGFVTADIEAANWTVAQGTANDAASLAAFAQTVLAGLDLQGAAAEVTISNVVPAVAGTKDAPGGTNGSYTVNVELKLDTVSATATVTGAAITATAHVVKDWETAMDGVLAYVAGITPDPIVGSTGGEWAVFALNRGGVATDAINNNYLANLQSYVTACNGKLHDKKYTEYSRVILALTSMGYDATQFKAGDKTYDLVTPLLDKQDSGAYWAEWQGNNGTCFALLALDSHGYLDNAEGNAARAGLIASLKANQMESGAWSISGGAADLDVTAAVVYALAPYYLDSAKASAIGVSQADIKAMVDGALAFLSGKQNSTGGLGSAEADVWAVIALASIGRDADSDPAFVKDGHSLLSNLLQYRDAATGGFKHLLSGEVNQMSSEQAAYGLVAYSRFKNGQKALYDMSDVTLTQNSGDAQSSGSGSGSGGKDKTNDRTITVTMRLIGAEKAAKDVDLGATPAYLPDYVTWIPTTTYTLDKGSTVYDLWTAATADAGIRSRGAESDYVATVYAPDALGGYALSEFTNGPRSGWMYTVNGRHPNRGLKNWELHDGDIVIWHYINDYSYEAADWFDDDPAYPSLGDGTYYNRWLKAPDYFGGAGGGVGNKSGGGTGGTGGGSGSDGADIKTTEIIVKADMVGDEAIASVNGTMLTEALEDMPQSDSVTMNVKPTGSDTVKLTLSADAVSMIESEKLPVTVKTELGTVKLDAGEVKGKKPMAVTVAKNEDGTMTVDVTSGGETVDAKVKVELPATGEDQMLVIVGADGTEKPVILSASEDGTVYAEIPAGATVKVVDAEGMEFGDVKADDWFAEAVEFVSSHGIFQGTGEGFEAGTTMNRAMLAMVLYRIDGATGGGSSTFADVNSDDWFADAVAWAADAGIVNGRGEGFAPDAPVTREEIATMLYRFVQHLGVDVSSAADLSKFPDGGETSSWAGDAMAWAVSVGLFKGDQNGALNPGGEATRAEVATLVDRLVKLLVK